jgi:hypothetical protein
MKSHTFRVNCSFVIQYSFSEDDVTADPEGNDDDIAPTEHALAQLQAEIESMLAENFAVASFNIESESDDLIGTAED